MTISLFDKNILFKFRNWRFCDIYNKNIHPIRMSLHSFPEGTHLILNLENCECPEIVVCMLVGMHSPIEDAVYIALLSRGNSSCRDSKF